MVWILIAVMFTTLVVIHEYGHFLLAKRNGVEVEEFGIGFPPKLAGRTMGKGIFRAYYTINLLPIGGFVKLKGENEADKRKGSFGAASFSAKARIILAGVTMNVIAAAVILTVLAWFGMPQVYDGQFRVDSDSKVSSSRIIVGYVDDGSPASQAGFEFGDEIITFAGTSLETTDQLFDLAEEYAGQDVVVSGLTTDGIEVSSKVLLNSEDTEDGYFGVSPTQITLEKSTWSAPITGIGLTGQLIWENLKGLGSIVAGLFSGNATEATENVAGPVGVFVLLRDVSIVGPELTVFFVATISVILAVMNSLPIPALDGGRLFVSWLFRALKRPLSAKTENAIHGTGFVLLIGLIVLITISDIGKFF